MKVRYYILIAIAAIIYGFYVCIIDHPKDVLLVSIMVAVFQVSFALGMGKMLKRNRRYHERHIWKDENSEF